MFKFISIMFKKIASFFSGIFGSRQTPQTQEMSVKIQPAPKQVQTVKRKTPREDALKRYVYSEKSMFPRVVYLDRTYKRIENAGFCVQQYAKLYC